MANIGVSSSKYELKILAKNWADKTRKVGNTNNFVFEFFSMFISPNRNSARGCSLGMILPIFLQFLQNLCPKMHFEECFLKMSFSTIEVCEQFTVPLTGIILRSKTIFKMHFWIQKITKHITKHHFLSTKSAILKTSYVSYLLKGREERNNIWVRPSLRVRNPKDRRAPKG